MGSRRWIVALLLAAAALAPAAAPAQAAGPVVSASWLEQNLSNPRVHTIEVDDEGTRFYSPGHIPGATLLDFQNDLQKPVVREFASAASVARALAKRGVSTGDTVVLYSPSPYSEGGVAAIYAYWVLKLRGIRVNPKILDGGSASWTRAGNALTAVVPTPSAGSVKTGEPNRKIRIGRDSILRSLGKRSLSLIDVRIKGEYDGQLAAPPDKPQGIVARKGHIPGAANHLWSRALASNDTFLPKSALREQYARYLEPDRAVASYCLRGERGVVTWFVLHELLGQKRAALYDGSWTEWGNLVNVPITR